MSRTVVPTVTLPPLLQAVLLWRDTIGQLSRWSRRHGDLFTLCLPSTGEVVVVGDPSAAHQILTSDPALSRTGSATGRVLLNAVFHGDSVTSRKELISALVDRQLDTWASGRVLAALPAMHRADPDPPACAVHRLGGDHVIEARDASVPFPPPGRLIAASFSGRQRRTRGAPYGPTAVEAGRRTGVASASVLSGQREHQNARRGFHPVWTHLSRAARPPGDRFPYLRRAGARGPAAGGADLDRLCERR